jgi:hypothetical protein
MQDAYIIESRKGVAGIMVRDGRGFRFFSATHDFNSLEGRFFNSPREAGAAVVRHAGSSRKPPKASPGEDVGLTSQAVPKNLANDERWEGTSQ